MPYAAARKIEGVSGVRDEAGHPRRAAGPVQRGARDADIEVERLVDVYSDLICRVSYTYLRSTQDAEDICQTVLMRLLVLMGSGSRRFASSEHERAWIIRATINACKDLLKSAHRQRTLGFSDIAGSGAPGGGAGAPAAAFDPSEAFADPRGAADLEAVEGPSSVLEAVMALPLMYRQAIYLYYYEGYSVREISAITGERDATVNAHLSRGRAKLREMLKGDAR